MGNVAIMEQVKRKKRSGDYIILAELLGISQDAAKTRVLRGNKEAMSAMIAIIENRDHFIREYQSKNQ